MPGAAPAVRGLRRLAEHGTRRAAVGDGNPAVVGAGRGQQRPRHQRLELRLGIVSGQGERKVVGMDRDPVETEALGQTLRAIHDRSSVRHELQELRLAEAERCGAPGETGQDLVHAGWIGEIAELEMHRAQARGPPRSGQRPHPGEEVGQRASGQRVEAGQNGSPGRSRDFDARALEPGIWLQRVVLEADDHPRGAGRHQIAGWDAGRELDDVVRRPAAPGTRDRARRHDAVRSGDADVRMDQGELGRAPIAQREQRRCAENRERLCRLGAGPTQAEPPRQPGVEPGGAVRPVEPDLAADPAPGALEQELSKRGGRSCRRALEHPKRLLEADVDIDAGAKPAQHQSCPLRQLRQALRQPGIALRPAGGAHSLTAPWVSPAMIRRWKNRTRSTKGRVTTTEAAARSPHGR